jgi:hypothetical protein
MVGTTVYGFWNNKRGRENKYMGSPCGLLQLTVAPELFLQAFYHSNTVLLSHTKEVERVIKGGHVTF